MPIAIALVVIFVLYLIDKHKLWRKALKLVIGLVVLSVLGIGGFLGWKSYRAYRDEKRKEAEGAAQLAEAAAEQARVSACISRLEKIPLPKDAVATEIPSDIQITCYGNSSATTYKYYPVQIPLAKKSWAVVKPQSGTRTALRDRCAFNPDVLPCGLGDGTVARLNEGDRVQILSDKIRSSGGDEIYQVKFQDWTGWMSAADLRPSK